MRGILLSLVFVGGASLGMSGCSGIPATVAESIATVDSNTQTNDANFRRVLDGYKPTDEEVAHWKASTVAQDDLSSQVNVWAQKHKKE